MDRQDEISAMDIGNICFNEPLSNHTSWRIGGPADIFVEPQNEEHLRKIVEYSFLKKVPYIVIGNGTNILVNDEGIRGIVIKIGQKFSMISINERIITADAGISSPELAKFAAQHCLGGIEHIVGIPGSIGGLVFMNGGSKGHCIGESVKRIWVLDKKANFRIITKEECHFSYRHSSLQETNNIIFKIELQCVPKDKSEIFLEMEHILEDRKRKIPLDFPNCGSIFLSDPSISSTIGPPGRIIDEAGLKGYRVGDAQVSEHHGNFIMNLGNARSCDVVSVVQHVRKKIFKTKNFWMDSEVKYITPYCEIIPLHQVKNES